MVIMSSGWPAGLLSSCKTSLECHASRLCFTAQNHNKPPPTTLSRHGKNLACTFLPCPRSTGHAELHSFVISSLCLSILSHPERLECGKQSICCINIKTLPDGLRSVTVRLGMVGHDAGVPPVFMCTSLCLCVCVSMRQDRKSITYKKTPFAVRSASEPECFFTLTVNRPCYAESCAIHITQTHSPTDTFSSVPL